jgi:hypothetical protein
MLNKDNLYYKLKYLKYKNKYLNYKKGGGGADTAIMNPIAPIATQHDVLTRYNERERKKDELGRQIKSTYDAMYPPSKDVTYLVSVGDIIGSINLDSFIRGNQQLEKIQFIIFIKMVFTGLSTEDFNSIMQYVYTDQLFTSDGINQDVLNIIKKYIQDTLIPDFIIDLLDSPLIQKFEDIQEKICIKISRIDAQIKQYLPNIKLFGDLDCKKFGSLTWISGAYIIKNEKLFNRLANSIEETEDEKGGRKLRKFIKCVISSDMDVSPKIGILEQIEQELIPLNNKYIDNRQCRQTGRWLTGIINRDVLSICYKYKHAKSILTEVEKQKKILKSEMSEKIKKESQDKIKRKELQENLGRTIKELKELLSQIDLLFKKEYDELDKTLNVCLPKIKSTNDTELKDQLEDLLHKIDQSQNFVDKQQHIATYNGLLARFDLNECIPITSTTTGLANMLLAIEQYVKSLKQNFIEHKIPIVKVIELT